jgi:aspartate/tyrosine/aromatic aminotransferase
MQRVAVLNNQFAHVQQAPADPILSLTTGFQADKNPKKCNLGVGAYRDDNGAPYVFPVVRKAEKLICDNLKLDKEYSPIDGLADFNKGARGAQFGWDHPDVNSGRIASFQTLSGTGALRVIAEFLHKFRPGPLFVSKPTWGNHKAVFTAAGVEVREYRYYKPSTKGIDMEGLIADLGSAPEGSAVLLHTCAHNPTGVDPSKEQWKQIFEVCKKNKLYPFFDTAYQGFTSGSLDDDAWGLRYFVDQGYEMIVAQSFAKVMGLYGERTGALHVVCADKATADKVTSQIKILVRTNYSSPPKHGARIASMLLNDPELRKEWLSQLVSVTKRMNDMRAALRAALEKAGTKGTWNHITEQIGMFSFTGLTPKQVDQMIKKHSIYMTQDGRISVCGVNTKNVEYIAAAIKDCVENY